MVGRLRPRVYAHRGASGNYFENTMKAFEGAVQEGADGIELDVQRSSDGVFFVIHDEDLARLTGVRKRISDLEAAEIRTLRVGSRWTRKVTGHRIPDLSSVLSFALMQNMSLNVELKETVAERPECLPALIGQLSVLSDYHISSFDYGLIELVKELAPDIESALLLRKSSLKENTLSDYPSADAFHFHKRMLTEAYEPHWQGTDKPIRVYGVDGTEPFVGQPPVYVSGWITDYPARFLS
ncbi:glycerophosphodiester phosphodiesterase [Sporosarcina sp. NCCP-2716]|uniref:glycerophosphodiester phosphodiesterase n=1 Tax=Sporosarcina sp. NCCP-2716 TaxID=2943679 RepID=UPI00203CD960|nr:glycerophosphodiester phosphodiesterase family protein [Sporosarcina sp. NCCP-2716]GKV68129.1 glycerophosphodiester phosphodiesterase [Sporosarcina sp. NCCP-2716]